MIQIKGVDPRMIANNLEPSEPIHPGEILKDEIKYRGISQHKLAAQMGITYSEINGILNAKRPITTEYALLFEAALDLDAEPLVWMQFDYDIQTSRRNKSFTERLANIRKSLNQNSENQDSESLNDKKILAPKVTVSPDIYAIVPTNSTKGFV
jgi:addiction module HigA family antidote